MTALASNSETTFILKQLDIYNWGPFCGRHKAEFDAEGSAIIGPTGSGKTTLVDALMTLITHQPKYNLASTGGHESDRDLLSYIRGISGAGNESGDNSHVTRPGKTVSAISALFSRANHTVCLGALFWIDSTSSSLSDLKRLWIFSEQNSHTLEDWLNIHHDGGTRALKRLEHETSGLKIHNSKKAYLAQLRRFFEVGENAFTLLNRAAGLKQLNSIDEIFRELVLDDHSAFDHAIEVAGEFDTLVTIRDELEIARNQQKSLIPIETANKEYKNSEEHLQLQYTLSDILPIWFAIASHKLWNEQVSLLNVELGATTEKIEKQKLQVEDLQIQVDTFKDIYRKTGGATIEQLKGQIETQHQLAEERRRCAKQYVQLVRNFGLDETLSKDKLYENQKFAVEHRVNLEEQLNKIEEDSLKFGAALHDSQKTIDELKEELDKIKSHPSSNIPGQFQDFRSNLAEAINVSENLLPFAAELLEVKPEQSSWRGAIERAIGGHRLRILVSSASMQQALKWVNHRDNRLHVRLLEAKTSHSPVKFLTDGFTRKINFKQHPHREALKSLLAGIDLHCVGSTDELRSTNHGITKQGLISGSKGRYDKHDQKPLNKGWMTGFDNKDRLASLEAELKEMEQKHAEHRLKYLEVKDKVKLIENNLSILEQLEKLEYNTIDLPGAEEVLGLLEERLKKLSDPQSDTGKALKNYERALKELKDAQNVLNELGQKQAVLKDRLSTALNKFNEAKDRIGDGLTDEKMVLAEKNFSIVKKNDLEKIDQLERKERDRIDKACKTSEEKRRQLQIELVRLMEKAKKVDTGALVEAGTDLIDIPAFLEQLRILNEEALPDKRKRFLDYLNQSSDQGTTQLLTGIENEVAIIEERIADLNNTLKRVDFNPGNYLQLIPKRVVHDSLRRLQNAQRHLRSAALKDDEGESHYRALENMVKLLRDAAENKRTVGARALLDPRYRLQFAVSVLHRKTDEVIETRTGSQGGSGGEKEIIASYILTASLSYALCPEGATRPLIGTIVLDEAFSKSSQAVAGRIISALNEFGLHPLFVTPNKEMRLLRNHTRSAILVHRKDMKSTLTSLSWEMLEEHARDRILKQYEVAI